MEEEGTAETTATETVKHLPTKDEHEFGTHLNEEHSREHRGKTTSTIILTVVFIALLATYIYLHGSDRFDVFQPKPTSSTVQPVPIIPWEDYKKQHPQQSSTPQPSVTSPQPSDSSTPSKTPAEPSPGESTGENGAETRQLFPPVHAPDNNEPSAPPSSPDSAARP